MAKEHLREKRNSFTGGMCFNTLLSCKVCSSCHISSFPAHSFISIHRFSDEEEKNIILLRLVEYLGHPNPYICAVAYDQVRNTGVESPISARLIYLPIPLELRN